MFIDVFVVVFVCCCLLWMPYNLTFYIDAELHNSRCVAKQQLCPAVFFPFGKLLSRNATILHVRIVFIKMCLEMAQHLYECQLMQTGR